MSICYINLYVATLCTVHDLVFCLTMLDTASSTHMLDRVIVLSLS
jgi:hypothetical protein